MPEPVAAEATPQRPPSPSELFVKTKAEKAAAVENPGEQAAAAVTPAPEKRASGDERKFRSALSRRDREIGELRAKIEALTPKQAAAAAEAATTDGPPKREKFATDEEFATARTAYEVKKELDKQKGEEQNSKVIKETLDAYNAKMAAAPEKYPDWADVLKAGTGAALSVDLGKECPSLLWAIAKSPYADDCFYNWLKDSTQLQKLIDTYKSGPQGELDALAAFHRFEGRVGKEAPEKPAAEKVEVKESKKADDAARTPKPKPSAEASVRGGTPAPDGEPEIYLKGTHTINPAWKAWRRTQQGK